MVALVNQRSFYSLGVRRRAKYAIRIKKENKKHLDYKKGVNNGICVKKYSVTSMTQVSDFLENEILLTVLSTKKTGKEYNHICC